MSIEISAKRFVPCPGLDSVQQDVDLGISGESISVRSGTVFDQAVGLVVSSPVNAHDHGLGVRTLGFGCPDDALESWIANLRLRPRTDPYLEALVAFSRVARAGVGTTMHCHNSHNADSLVDEAAMVVRAASDVGVRLALSCPLLDHDPWTYGGPERLRDAVSEDEWAKLEPKIPSYGDIETQIAAIEEIIRQHQSTLVDVQFGPIGPQWCSDDLLKAIAEASERTGRRIHMHLMESPRQRRWLDERFPQGVVQFLDDIGFLSPRLAVAHGVQLNRQEIDLLAERGVQLVSNPSANLRLRSGVAPIADAVRAGLTVALGLDGTGFDDDQDVWREMRLLRLLHGGRQMDTALPDAEIFRSAIRNGRKVTGFSAVADVTLIDFEALCDDFLFDDLDPADILLTRMRAEYAQGLIVEGKWVMRDGELVSVDFDDAKRELHAQAKADLPRLSKEREVASLLHRSIKDHYRKWE